MSLALSLSFSHFVLNSLRFWIRRAADLIGLAKSIAIEHSQHTLYARILRPLAR